MKQRLKYLICFLVYYSGILWLYSWFRNSILRKGRLTILMYHRVSNNDYSNPFLCTPPNNFKRQIQYLTKRYKIISLEKFSKYVHSQNPPAQNYIAITFDDGYRDNYTNAFPILKRYKVPVTVFLVTGYIGTNKLFWWDRVARIVRVAIAKHINMDFPEDIYPREIKDTLVKISSGDISNPTEATSLLSSLLKEISEEQKNLILDDLEKKILPLLKNDPDRPYPLTWQEVRQMSEYGIEFGAHTVTHPILTRVGNEQAEHEISHSKAEIERKICKRVFHFSYPNGKKSDFNERIKQLVKNAGFLSACSTVNGTNGLQDDIFSLRRRAVDDSPIYIFAAEIAGFFDLLILLKEKIKEWHSIFKGFRRR